jgi:hypothetical protein
MGEMDTLKKEADGLKSQIEVSLPVTACIDVGVTMTIDILIKHISVTIFNITSSLKKSSSSDK